jgi:predicted exporter
MIAERARIIALWLIAVAIASWVVARAHYLTDMSAFLPAKPSALQSMLVDQLRDGPASRLILIAIEGGDAELRARVSDLMASRLRDQPEFSLVDNGAPASEQRERDRKFLFEHRYLLSDAVTPARFTAEGLSGALSETIEELAGPTGLMIKELAPRDPTGELLHILDGLTRGDGPRMQNGAWASSDASRALLMARTVAPGSDTDAQEHALNTVRGIFQAAAGAAGAPAAVRLRMSGPGVFAVSARDNIKRAATRLSVASSLLVIAVLATVYRSVTALALGLLPVATGALCGVAAVALGFGAVHGITLGFGVTLIGESVDYSIYFFIQSREGGASVLAWQRRLWPTIRLGMLTSVCGFASLLPSGFPGLAQLGVYSISGLIAAAAVTRFVLPQLLPRAFKVRDVTPLGEWLRRRRERLREHRLMLIGAACLLGLAAIAILAADRSTLWNRELSRLSPVPAEQLRYDAALRADLGASDVGTIVVAGGSSEDAAIENSERAAAALRPLIEAGVIADLDSPATYLPSIAQQTARRAALPGRAQLEAAVRVAARAGGWNEAALAPFIDDVDAARSGPLLTREALRGTTLQAALDSLLLQRAGRFMALLPLHAPASSTGQRIDAERVAAALGAARLSDVRVLDVKAQADDLYAGYLQEAIRLSLWGLALIVALLLIALRSPARTARVLAPLCLAVLTVAAGLAASGRQLNLLHLVGMLLIIAVGSNYALFFDRAGGADRGAESLTLASLAIANLSTVIAFGLLSFSSVPVLQALGETVAPGAFLALLFSALLTAAPTAARDA